MIIFKSINKLNKEVNFKANVGFVPTMGYLHNGHISLIRASKKSCKKTLVSIFINPSQFNKKNDFKTYPKNLKKDIATLKRLKVDYLLVPRVSEIYKNKKDKKIKLNKRDKIMCAFHRPGHFEGVLAVINQFLRKISPKFIFLGEKDYQQLLLIKKFINNRYKTKVYSCPTVRMKNKVALSSRNALLKKEDIKKSSYIANLLFKFRNKLIKDFSNKKYLSNILIKISKIKNIKIEYLEIRSKINLSKKFNKYNFKIFVCYYNNKVRLIDNY